jgi:DNA-binding FrmR family transcriptional regulator
MRGYYDDKAALLGRLRRIEGQVRGLQRMVENDEYCIDILTQVSAASNALKKVALGLLDDHIRHCVANHTESGKDMVREATAAIERLVRS